MRKSIVFILLMVGFYLFPGNAFAEASSDIPSFIHSPFAITALVTFILAYIAVVTEEFTYLSKSKPVMLAAAIIWVMVAIVAKNHSLDKKILEDALNHNLIEYASLFLFLLVAMTYINVMVERNVFETLRCWLIGRGFSLRKIFWITGFLAFFISPVADNLTTALLMGSVLLAIGAENKKFIVLSFINVVVAANAGGAFSPFGDITTLMVWQSGKAEFFHFLTLFLPAFVNFFIPAFIMNFAIPKSTPEPVEVCATLKPGAITICLLFFMTITLAVLGERLLDLPPFLGMLAGLSILFFYSYFMKINANRYQFNKFNIFNKVAKAEWDTLFFFYGVIFSVGGLAFLGYLNIASAELYQQFGATKANIAVGLASSIIDNIPVMFAVLTMDPQMNQFQWLLITLTAGVGGSVLSIGSAAGVALMGQSRFYSFAAHLKWSWAILLGYAASIWVHFLIG
ncbi:MAG TPA: sodium:proton antiporter [Aeromonadales bacterium]|nr:sodium:proton antiporter [Aeromonadales bacterium]